MLFQAHERDQAKLLLTEGNYIRVISIEQK